jgi:ketol-acid reductoisomerase
MRYSVSDTGRVGRLPERPAVVDGTARGRCEQVLAEIQDGTFAKRWIAEADAGFPSSSDFASRRRRPSSSRWDGSCAR